MNIDEILEHWTITFRSTPIPRLKECTWSCELFDLQRHEKSTGESIFHGLGENPTEALNKAIIALREEEKREEGKKKGFKSGGIGLHFLIEEEKRKKSK
jgi:hypothetical protein